MTPYIYPLYPGYASFPRWLTATDLVVVEMEALTAVTAVVYDIMKPVR